MQRVLQHRYICPIKSLNGRRRIRQMLSFPDDRAVGITPILGQTNAATPYIGATAAYFHDIRTEREASGSWQKLYFTLEKLRFMLPMREVTVFGFANVSPPPFPVPLRVMQRKSERVLHRRYYGLNFSAFLTRAQCILKDRNE